MPLTDHTDGDAFYTMKGVQPPAPVLPASQHAPTLGHLDITSRRGGRSMTMSHRSSCDGAGAARPKQRIGRAALRSVMLGRSADPPPPTHRRSPETTNQAPPPPVHTTLSRPTTDTICHLSAEGSAARAWQNGRALHSAPVVT